MNKIAAALLLPFLAACALPADGGPESWDASLPAEDAPADAAPTGTTAYPCGDQWTAEKATCDAMGPGMVAYCARDASTPQPFASCAVADAGLWCCPFAG